MGGGGDKHLPSTFRVKGAFNGELCLLERAFNIRSSLLGAYIGDGRLLDHLLY